MNKTNPNLARRRAGFTLMELLIVIGVLGILAAGLLAAIDPFEQLKKARDTNNRSAAIEFLGSSQRYYTTHGYLPWFKPGATVGTYDTNCTDANNTWGPIRTVAPTSIYPRQAVMVDLDLSTGNVIYDCIVNTLGTDGEIKSTFFAGLKTPIYIMSGSTTNVGVCFAPEGRSNLSDAQSRYVYNETDKTIDKPDAGCTDANKAAGFCLQCFE